MMDRCKGEYIWETAEKVEKRSILINWPEAWPTRLKKAIVVGGYIPGISFWVLFYETYFRAFEKAEEIHDPAIDNIFIERLWRSVKYEEVYINDYETVPDAKEGISRYMNFYNQERPHQSLDYKTPAEVYFGVNNQNRETSRYLKQGNFVS